MIRTIALSALSLGMLAPTAFAACDISQTKCALNGGKCNIKFRNLTGASSGMAGGTDLSQESWAQTIKVKALKENGHTAGKDRKSVVEGKRVDSGGRRIIKSKRKHQE